VSGRASPAAGAATPAVAAGLRAYAPGVSRAEIHLSLFGYAHG
jgi:hypothetical protein